MWFHDSGWEPLLDFSNGASGQIGTDPANQVFSCPEGKQLLQNLENRSGRDENPLGFPLFAQHGFNVFGDMFQRLAVDMPLEFMLFTNRHPGLQSSCPTLGEATCLIRDRLSQRRGWLTPIGIRKLLPVGLLDRVRSSFLVL